MPDLVKSLEGRDLGYLRIIAELWGVEFDAPDARLGIARLAPLLMDVELVEEVVGALPQGVQEALGDMLRGGGKLPWSQFIRRYGGVREMGPGKRDRERPYLNVNASPAEALWYRALVGRSFFDTKDGPLEYAYIPEDLLAVLPIPVESGREPLGRPASPAERQHLVLADDSLLDDACTLLAAIRSGISFEDISGVLHCGEKGTFALTPKTLSALLTAAGLLDADGVPVPETTRQFLEAERSDAMAMLARAWRLSEDFNELRQIPGLIAEGEWRNDPLRTREVILDLMATVPGLNLLLRAGEKIEEQTEESVLRSFWSMEAFVAAICQTCPDFQRQAGDYDSWYLRSVVSGEYLRGYEHWDEVDGLLLRFFIAGTLHWLGVVDLALPAMPDDKGLILGGRPMATAFRFSAWGAELLRGEAPASLRAQSIPKDAEKINLRADGRIRISKLAPRAARYQLARFGEWQGYKDGFYRYRLTPVSLRAARSAGLQVHHLLALLHRHVTALPPNLVNALERWELHGEEARLEQVSVLRVKDPALLVALRRSRAARFLGDELGPTAVVVYPGGIHQILAALAELGYLGEVNIAEKNVPE